MEKKGNANMGHMEEKLILIINIVCFFLIYVSYYIICGASFFFHLFCNFSFWYSPDGVKEVLVATVFENYLKLTNKLRATEIFRKTLSIMFNSIDHTNWPWTSMCFVLDEKFEGLTYDASQDFKFIN